MAFDIALFGWHATIFIGGWVLVLRALSLAVVVVLVVRVWLGEFATTG